MPQQLLAAAEPKQTEWLSDFRDKTVYIVLSLRDMINFMKKPQDAKDVVFNYWQKAAAFAKRVSNGTYCVTKMGYAGLMPGDVRTGDEVCVFTGGGVPFVLRRTGVGETYTLVGAAYVHGLMYGEAMSLKHIQEKDFKLA